jgi:2-polyprenyl-6-methoxyphenol hydroxylase-like FAD-dependent oxidoreductase
MSPSTDVVICGAGPVGLTLGSELLRRGVAVRLVERVDHSHPHAKAIILWPRALEALARIGAADEILHRGHVIRAQNYSSGARRLARTSFEGLSWTRHPYALSLPQEQTEDVLRKRFADLGGTIEFGVRLEGFRQTDAGVELDLTERGGKRTASCRWLVGCDGAHSTVREVLAVPFTGSSYVQRFLLADGEWETELAHDEAHYFMAPSGVLVVVGLPGGLYRVFASVGPETPADDPAAVVTRAAAERCPVPLRPQGTQRTGVFQVHRRAAERFRRGRVLLAGDAAHIHSPAGGQGLNTGIEDASSLAWRLAQVLNGSRPLSVLDEWERERRHVATGVVRDTDRQTRLWMLRGWRAGARDVVLRAAERSGLLDRLVVPRQAQLTLAYPGERRRAGRITTGRRVPDVTLPGGGWLQDLLRSPRTSLVLFAAPGSPGLPELAGRWAGAAELDVVRVEGGAVRAALGLRVPTAAVVRPDGVVSWVGRAADRQLDGWLAERFSGESGRLANEGVGR